MADDELEKELPIYPMFGVSNERQDATMVCTHQISYLIREGTSVMPIRKGIFLLEYILTRSMAGQQAYQGIRPDSRLLYYDHQRARSGNIIYAK